MTKLGILAGFGLLLLGACTTESVDAEYPASVNFSATVPSDVVVIDFEGFEAGDIVSTVVPNDGCDGSIGVFAENPNLSGNSAMIFDSSNPTGGDFDLGTPNEFYGGPGISDEDNGENTGNETALGKVLIITEDGDATDPDDSYVAGTYYELDFSSYGIGLVTLYGFDMLDLDGAGTAKTEVFLYDGLGNELFSLVIEPGIDNNKQWVDLQATSGVAKMVLELNNSGAIDNISLKCEDREKFEGCETAFGFGGMDATCFIGNGFNRWGWTNELGEGESISLELYAGAGQCDLEKGTLVGYVDVTYMDGTATATYELFDGIELKETHFYAGDTMFPMQERGKKKDPKPTVAPGQYPTSGGPVLSVDGLEGGIWVIAHAVVCGED